MTHPYQVTGMTCSGCELKVKGNLLSIQDITSVEISKDSTIATITMDMDIPLERMQEAIGGTMSKYQLFTINNKSKSMFIRPTPEKVFAQMDDFSKTGMHMSESSMMMMGSKLKLEQLSLNPTGIGATYRWSGKIMGMAMDFSESVTKWQSPKLKEWEIIGEAKIIIMSWYRMWFEIAPSGNGTIATISISYLPPKEWYYKILSFLFVNWYCNWCLNNMLNDTKKSLEKSLLD